MGQVTPLPSVAAWVRWLTSPRVIHGKSEWPSLSCQGCRWSLAHRKPNPACSAADANSTSWDVANCSWESTKPTRFPGGGLGDAGDRDADRPQPVAMLP